MPPRDAVPQAGVHAARRNGGAVRRAATAALMAVASLGAPVLPATPMRADAQGARSRAESAARRDQRRFEQYRRFLLPTVPPRDGRCDVRIGRFCYWDDNHDPRIRAERPEVLRARARLRASLDSLAAIDPTSDFIAGQQVRYALEAGDVAGAVALTAHCAASPWWCHALRGLALHRAGRETASASVFDSALAAMPNAQRCAWLDVGRWLPSGAHLADSTHTCAARERASERVFWLAAPLLTWKPDAMRDEMLARRTLGVILAGTAIPHRLGWGSDLAEMSLRYGWPDQWAREEDPGLLPTGPDISVLGNEPRPSFSFLPDRHALDAPFDAEPEDWRLTGDREATMRYAPGWLRAIDTLSVQIARFRRAGGDSMVVVAAYDAGDSLRGDTVSAAALLSAGIAPGSTLAFARGDASPQGAIVLEAPARRALAAVEVVDSARRRAARWRAGIAPLPGTTLVSDLLVGVAVPDGPPTLKRHARFAIAPLRVTARDTIALYWESYARASPGAPARVTLRLTPLSAGLFRRVARGLGLAQAREPLALAWDDPGTPDSASARSLRVGIPDVPAGRYRIELVIEAAGSRGVASRVLVVEKRPR